MLVSLTGAFLSLAFEIGSASFRARVEEVTGRFSLQWICRKGDRLYSKSVLPWESPPPSFVYIEVDGVGAIIDGRMVPVVKPPRRGKDFFEGYFSFEGININQELYFSDSLFCEQDSLAFSMKLNNPGRRKKIRLAYVMEIPGDSYIISPFEGTVAEPRRRVFLSLDRVPPYLLFSWDDTPTDMNMALILEGRALTPDKVLLSDFSEVYPHPFKVRGPSKSHLSGRRALTLMWEFELPGKQSREVRFFFATAEWHKSGQVMYLKPRYFAFPFPLVMRFRKRTEICDLKFEEGYFSEVNRTSGFFYPSSECMITLILFPEFVKIPGFPGRTKGRDVVFINSTSGSLNITLNLSLEKSPSKGEVIEFLRYSRIVERRALEERANLLAESQNYYARARFMTEMAISSMSKWNFKKAYQMSLGAFSYYEKAYKVAVQTWERLRKETLSLIERVKPLDEDPLKEQVLSHLYQALKDVERKDVSVEGRLPELKREVEMLIELLYWKKIAKKAIAQAGELREKAERESADSINITSGLFNGGDVFLKRATEEFDSRLFKSSAADARRSLELFELSYRKALKEWERLQKELEALGVIIEAHPRSDPLGEYLSSLLLECRVMIPEKNPKAFGLVAEHRSVLSWYKKTLPDLLRALKLLWKVNVVYPGLRRVLAPSDRASLDFLLVKSIVFFRLRQYRVSMYYLEALLSQIKGFKHVVEKGDTLWDISAKYYNKPWLWRRIYYANMLYIKNPHWIYPGQIFFVPVRIKGVQNIELLEENIVLKLYGYQIPEEVKKYFSEYPLDVPFGALRRIYSKIRLQKVE